MNDAEAAASSAPKPAGPRRPAVPGPVVASARALSAAITEKKPEIAERRYGALQQLFAAEALQLRDRKPRTEFERFFQWALKAERSFGQIHQDLFALWATRGKRNGFFLEIGVGNGVNISNTYLLEEDYGWRGILCEPHPDQTARIRARRRAVLDTRCVTDRTGDVVGFDCATSPELSRSSVAARDTHDSQGHRQVARTVEVPTVSLADLLEEHNAPTDIDFLSLDIEGGEYLVLRDFPFERWRFAVACIEHNHGEQRRDIHRLLTGHGYRRVFEAFSRFDDWYLLDALLPQN